MPDKRYGAGSPSAGHAEAAGTESTITLLARAHGGDDRALEQLMARHLTPLRRWARGRLPKWARDAADTDDLVQDALLQTFKRLDHVEIREPGALQAYLRRAVVNHIRNELRKRSRRPALDSLDGPDRLDGLEIAQGLSPLEEAIGRESLERYQQAMARLRPEEREAIIGRIEMGYSYDELAEVLDKPSAEAARKAAKRALLRLAEEMNRGTT